MAVDKEFYNEASASKLGWEPEWFIPGHKLFDKRLTKAIKMVKSPKTGAYTFVESIMDPSKVNDFIAKN